MRQIIATKRLTFTDVLSGWHLRSASAGPDGAFLLLATEHAPERSISASGRRRKKPGPPLAYRLYIQQDSTLTFIDLPPTQDRLPFAQPLGPNQWLMAAPRSTEARSAHIYSGTGQRLRSLHLGDAIADVQTTRAGQMWVSYFDEGVFSDDAFGQGGVVCLDQNGRPLFTYNALAEQRSLLFIADCHAMNVCSDDETWLYFYTDFPLVRIAQGKIEHVWHTIPVHGAHAFALAGNLALFAGSYQQRHGLFLVTLGTLHVEQVQPINDRATSIPFVVAFGRGSMLYLRDEQSLYSIDLAQIDA